ncbi:hypothetical protein SAMN05216420_1044 [Nitrosospira sp. Nl5]|nr:hypothetical protein SAMN05216420_1044 [Nitrosospira sp. Nl5]
MNNKVMNSGGFLGTQSVIMLLRVGNNFSQ